MLLNERQFSTPERGDAEKRSKENLRAVIARICGKTSTVSTACGSGRVVKLKNPPATAGGTDLSIQSPIALTSAASRHFDFYFHALNLNSLYNLKFVICNLQSVIKFRAIIKNKSLDSFEAFIFTVQSANLLAF
jgi:hypothetical protein